MQRVFKEQRNVVKDYRRYLTRRKGEAHQDDDLVAALRRLVVPAGPDNNGDCTRASAADKEPQQQQQEPSMWGEAVEEADTLLELIEDHQEEIRELEEAAMRNCQQVGRRPALGASPPLEGFTWINAGTA